MSEDTRQQKLGLQDTEERVEEFKFEPIKGFPMLRWNGKRPFSSIPYYPAQHRETHGVTVDGWKNKIYWGDNLQVMSHLLKDYRRAIKLVYIDPPYDSKADYKKKISLRGQNVTNDKSVFEEKQYTDIWTNDEYLQFMYERLILIRELMSEDGTIYVHLGPNISHYVKLILDEVFGSENYVNEIIWRRAFGHSDSGKCGIIHDSILLYGKSIKRTWNRVFHAPDPEYIETFFDQYDEKRGERYQRISLSADGLSGGGYEYEYKGVWANWRCPLTTLERYDNEGKLHWPKKGVPRLKRYESEYEGTPVQDIWTDISKIHNQSPELLGYPTQKPEALLERIIRLSSNPGDLVFDCFMGSGTTQAVAMGLGRRFIGADINLGAIQLTTKRLLMDVPQINRSTQLDLVSKDEAEQISSVYTGFDIYNVNHYDIFKNPLEAKDILLQALEVNPLQSGHLFDGEKDGRMIKIMPVNRIATRQDLNELIYGFDQRAFERRADEHPNQPVEKITLVCMGHERDLAAYLQQAMAPYKLDVEVVDILRDKQNLQFKRDAEAKISVQDGILLIEKFYPMNLLSKLSLQAESVEDWRELVESVMIDWNYDGAVFQPTVTNIPEEGQLVEGRYPVPEDAGTIRVQITDLLSEALEQEIQYG
jgi:site-specific DNA-methyltransferase (adenine-specific)/adenine-specific DNA-methyltransferase